jgi:hypothetical protein
MKTVSSMMAAVVIAGSAFFQAGCVSTNNGEVSQKPEVYATHEDLVLMARLESLIAEENNNERSREGINHTRSVESQALFDVMRGKKAVQNEKQLGWPRQYMKGATEGILKSRVWPAPPAVKVSRAKAPIVVDGLANEADWKSAQAVPIRHPYASTNVMAGPVATCQLLWDEKNLYVYYEVPDTNIVSSCTNRDDAVSQSDAVEIFLLPSKRFGQYWEFNFGPSGIVFDSLMSKFMNQWGSDARTEENAAVTVATKIQGSLNQEDDQDRSYSVEVAIPWSELPGFQHGAQAGDSLWTMIGWANKASLRVPGNPAYYSHTPVLAWFHNIWGYSQLTLE